MKQSIPILLVSVSLIAPVKLVLGQQLSKPKIIDGKSNPELIPDSVAYRMFFWMAYAPDDDGGSL